MRKLFSIAMGIMLAMGSFACSGAPSAKGESAEANLSARSVEVFYFHRNRRCGPCTTIENLARKTIETHFKQEVENGEIIFSVVNIEQEQNRAVAQKFNIASVALVLNEKNGSEEQSQNLTSFAYRYVRNEEAFVSGLKDFIDRGLGR